MTRTIRMLTVCFALMLGFTTLGISTAQAATIATGTVYSGNTGDELSGVSVKVYASEADAEAATGLLETATTGVDGVFDITQDDGNYYLAFEDPAYESLIQGVTVDENNPALGSFYLDHAIGTISGTIVGPDNTAFGDECTRVDFYDATGTAGDDNVTGTYDDSSGAYETTLPVGTYKVRANNQCEDLPISWSGGVDFDSAATFAVTADATTVVPVIKITAGATITGVVNNASSLPIVGIQVRTYATDPELGGDLIASTYTNAAGQYKLYGHEVGTYKVRFADSSHEYAGEWYADGATFDDGTPVAVTNTDDVALNATVLSVVPDSGDTKVLSGMVVNKNGTGLFGIEVSAEGPSYATTTTRRDGSYSFVAADLEPGEYRLYYYDAYGDALDERRYLSQYYLGKDTYSTATTVAVTGAAKAVTAVKLVGYGAVSGTVAVPATYENNDLYVSLYDADDQVVMSRYASDSGAYNLSGIAPGSYRVRFSGEGESDDFGYNEFVSEWFNNKSTFASSLVVVVKDLATTSSINVTMSDQLTAYVVPKVSGTAKKGKTLKASVGTWNRVTNTVYAYQWYRGTSAINSASARKSSYVLTSSDVGKTIKVKVSASHRYDYFRPGFAFSKSTAKVVK